jgi:hypothetical protein
MFTATTTKKDFRSGVFQVTVEYQNGSDTFTEAYNINSEEDLNNRIENKLNTLNNLLALESSLVIGAWTKPVKEEYVPDPVQEALNKVYEAKGQLGAKLITETEYDAVVLAYKTLASGEIKK